GRQAVVGNLNLDTVGWSGLKIAQTNVLQADRKHGLDALLQILLEASIVGQLPVTQAEGDQWSGIIVTLVYFGKPFVSGIVIAGRLHEIGLRFQALVRINHGAEIRDGARLVSLS